MKNTRKKLRPAANRAHRKSRAKDKQHLRLILAALVFGTLMAVMYFPAPRASAPARMEAETLTGLSPMTTPAPGEDDPLQIAAIRAKSYPSSAIVVEQDLGVSSGLVRSIVSYQSDGLKIRALMSIPSGTPPGTGWPVVVLGHGYINPAEYRTEGSEYSDFIATLNKSGYAVIKPDYRGHGQSEGVAAGGHFSPVYTYDLLNLTASLKQDARFDKARIGFFGHSMSGHTGLRALVVNRDIKAAVFMAGVVGSFSDIFYNWPNSPMASDLPAVVQTTKRQYIEAYGDPRTNSRFWDGASALNYARDISAAVQVNHDEADSVVPVAFSDHLTAALKSAGKTVEARSYPGDDHQFVSNRSAILQNMLAFYQAHL